MELIVRKEISPSDSVSKVWTLDFSSNKWNDLDCASLESLLVRRSCVFIEKNSLDGKLVYIAKHKDLLKILKGLF